MKIWNAGLAMGLSLMAAPARAEEATAAIDLGLSYIADGIAVQAGNRSTAYYLDSLEISATADLGRLTNWRGATAYVHLLNNLGGMPNDVAGTLQGVDNIEVGSQRLRLYQAWIEQRIGGRTSVKAGLYDLNSEFYANDAAGLLVAPAFGVGSEIAATGPNGPSLYPSTALAVRIDQRVGGNGYLRAAILNASAGTLGDPQGVNLSFDDGALLVGEGGIEGEGKLAVGIWGYTRRQDDVRDLDAAGDPLRRRARGAYIVAEQPLNDAEGVRAATLFVRAGVSDGRTTPFSGGWQAGLLVEHVLAVRPHGTFSIGANQAFLSAGYRRNLRDEGSETARAETAFEITYADRLAPWLTLQPDFQIVFDAGGNQGADPVYVAGFRVSVEL